MEFSEAFQESTFIPGIDRESYPDNFPELPGEFAELVEVD